MERPAKGIHIVPSVSTRPKSARVQSAPTSGDKELLIVAQSAEMAVHDLYKNAVAKAGFTGDELATIAMFAEHHLAYAQAIGGLLGSEAPFERSETIYQQFVAALRLRPPRAARCRPLKTRWQPPTPTSFRVSKAQTEPNWLLRSSR